MLKPLIISLAIILAVSSLRSQNNIYELLPPGTYLSGFCDTIIMNPDITYNHFGYIGPAPLFVKIWHPIKEKNQQYLTFGDFRKHHVPVEMTEIYNELMVKSEVEFIDYNLTYSLPDELEIDYGSHTPKEIFDSLLNVKTISVRSPININNEFPVIVYHHGAQSIAEENFVMAEYFASKGYIFVSANFHLPYLNMPYGGAPFLSDQVYKNDQSNLKLLIQFAKSLSYNKQRIFIGHSWGAQSGWGLLHESGLTDVFISLETTLEDKTDSVKIKERWPELYQLIQIEKTHYPMPILLLAGNDQPVPFPFFENVTAPELIHVSTRDYFAHNSFTSTFLMRYYFKDQFTQPDTAMLQSQISTYLSQLNLIEHFISSSLLQQPFELYPFEELYYIHSK